MTGGAPQLWRVDEAGVPALIEAILNPHRRHSLVLVSPAGDTGKPRIDVEVLLDNTRDLPTDVVQLESMDATVRLSDSISSAFHCYGGSVRVVMPNARVTDHYRRHPLILIYPTDDPRLSLRRVIEAAERTPPITPDEPASSGTPIPVAVPLPSQLHPKPGPPAASPHPVAPRAVEASPPEAAAPVSSLETRLPVSVPDVTPAHTAFGLADIETVVARAVARTLEEQLGGPSSETERERSRADTAEEHLAQALERVRHLETQLAQRQEAGVLPIVHSDPEQQLRWELDYTWLTSIPETDRRQPLPAWSIGDGFCDGLAKPVVPRRKTIAVMIQILRGSGWESSTTHQFLESRGGQPRVSPTGTTIWRTYVKEDTPQAPRLTWWTNPDGTYHFDHVGGHDDLI